MANNILEMALEQLDFPPSTISAWFDDVTVVSFGDNSAGAALSGAL